MKRLCICLVLSIASTHAFTQDGEIVDTVISTVDSVFTEDGESETNAFHFDQLQRESIRYVPLSVPDSTLNKLKADEAFWYANIAPKEKKLKQPNTPQYTEPFYVQKWFRTLVWILVIGGFLAVVIWFLISSDIKLFRKKSVSIYQNMEGDLPEDIFSINYENELEKALAAGNYRMGVRLMFLHVLKLMDERELIKYKAEKTNSDYLLQLWNTSYYNDFFKLTRHFEYVWYGKFEISKDAFAFVEKEYHQLKAKMS